MTGTTQAVIIRKATQPIAAPVAPARDLDRAFGLAVYSGFLQIALAFYRRYVGAEPKCKCGCGCAK